MSELTNRSFGGGGGGGGDGGDEQAQHEEGSVRGRRGGRKHHQCKIFDADDGEIVLMVMGTIKMMKFDVNID